MSTHLRPILPNIAVTNMSFRWIFAVRFYVVPITTSLLRETRSSFAGYGSFDTSAPGSWPRATQCRSLIGVLLQGPWTHRGLQHLTSTSNVTAGQPTGNPLLARSCLDLVTFLLALPPPIVWPLGDLDVLCDLVCLWPIWKRSFPFHQCYSPDGKLHYFCKLYVLVVHFYNFSVESLCCDTHLTPG